MSVDIEAKAEELTKEIGPVLAVAGEIVVRDAETYKAAGETWKELTGLENRITDYWKTDVEAARNLHKSLVAKRDAMLVPVGERKNALRIGMKAFEDDQERARRAAQAAAEAVATGPVVVESAIPAGFGAATRRTWGAEVYDKLALVKAVAEGKAPLEAVEAAMPVLNGLARSLKGALSVPGVRAVER
jgi:hypothetical protein